MKMVSGSAKRTAAIGKVISKYLKPGDIVCLQGNLGSGKTVLAKGIASGLGVDPRSVMSPTFVLIRQYLGGRMPVYHLDLYRLGSCDDIAGLGYEEYLYGQGVCLIEWADRMSLLMPHDCLTIAMKVDGDTSRLLRLKPRGSRYEILARQIYECFRDRYDD
jgi:tRNA threonylcarbamoyladenosine biosynthesis protein TsaE